MRRPYELWSMMLAGLVVAALFGTQASAAQTNLFATDFDTDNQYNAQVWTAVFGGGTNGFTFDYAGGPTYDTDGDGLSAIIYVSSFAGANGVRTVYAPLFKTFGNLTVSGWGSGDYPNYNTISFWELSDDGTNYDYTTNTANYLGMHFKSVSSGTDPAYNGINTVWARVRVRNETGSGGSASARTAAFKLDGEIQSGLNKRVWILMNDFGTDAQISQWTIASSNFTSSALSASSDMDGDLLARGLANTNSEVTSELVQRIDAPANTFFQYPVFQAFGNGNFNFDTYTRIYLSTDGATYPWMAVNSNAPSGTTLTLDTTGVAALQRVRSVWVKIKLEGNGWYPISQPPFIRDVRISAILLPIPAGTIVAVR